MEWQGFDLRDVKKARTIGVVSIKGGVGKTTTVLSLGASLVHDFKKKVLLVDANFSGPTLGIHVGLVDPEKTIHDVLLNKVGSREAVHTHEYGFDILPANLRTMKIDPFKLKKKLEPLKNDYDVILIDSSPNLNDEILATMVASDELLVVTTPDYPTLSSTMHAVKIAKGRKVPITGLVLNKVRNKKFEISLAEVEEAAETNVIAVLPDDVKALEALAHTIPFTMHSPHSDAVVEYRKLAGSLVGERFRDPRRFKRLKDRYLMRTDKQVINRDLLREQKRK